jgi:hypothetical protein
MKHARASKVGLVLGLYALTSLLAGCVLDTGDDGGYYRGGRGEYRGEYREGYYDREHGRWYHNHGWVRCDRDDDHCRR